MGWGGVEWKGMEFVGIGWGYLEWNGMGEWVLGVLEWG